MGQIKENIVWDDHNNKYKNINLQELEAAITTNLNLIKKSFITVGFLLRLANEKKLYEEAGYKNIYEYASDKFGLSRSSAWWYMAINAKYSKDGFAPELDERYKDFDKCQLQEMFKLPEDQLEHITPDMTILQIRETKKALAPIEIAGCQCTKVDEWTTDGDTYILGNCIDDNSFYYASVGGKDFEFDRKPTREEVESHYIDYLAMQDIDRHEAEVMGFCMSDIEPEREQEEVRKPTEEELVIEFYKYLYTSEKEIIQKRNAADITKMFKKKHGSTHEGVRDIGFGWNCYPDKICFTIHGIGQVLQITWGKFTTKLLRVLDDHPELEKEPEGQNITDYPEAMPDTDGECQECYLNNNAEYGDMECHPERGEHKCYSGEEEDDEEDCAISHKTDPEKSIDELDLSVYTYNILKRSGIDTILELQAMSDEELAKLRGMGLRSLNEIKTKLKEYQAVLCDVAQSVADKPESVANAPENVSDQVIDGACIELPEEPAASEWPDLLSDMPVFARIAVRDYLDKQEHELREYQKVEATDGNFPEALMLKKKMAVAGARLLLRLVETIQNE